MMIPCDRAAEAAQWITTTAARNATAGARVRLVGVLPRAFRTRTADRTSVSTVESRLDSPQQPPQSVGLAESRREPRELPEDQTQVGGIILARVLEFLFRAAFPHGSSFLVPADTQYHGCWKRTRAPWPRSLSRPRPGLCSRFAATPVGAVAQSLMMSEQPLKSPTESRPPSRGRKLHVCATTGPNSAPSESSPDPAIRRAGALPRRRHERRDR